MDIQKLIGEMTLEEKASLCSGADFWRTRPVERLGVPAVMMTDGPHGLRKQKSADVGTNDTIEAVCFPTAAALASSFDPELVEEIGRRLGVECQAEDVAMLLGPGLNIKRSPLCGRNFEYFSEDPHVAGKIAAAFVKGVQSQGVVSCAKHFAANNQETRRMSVSAEADERTLREVYLPAFEMVVKEGGAKSLMCSYNRINGTYSSENKWLLTDVLRGEWGFDGFVVTDWGAVKDRVKGILAGLDLQMPGDDGALDKKIVAAVNDGSLAVAELDKAVANMLTFVDNYMKHRKADATFDFDGDRALAAEAAARCAVLLKNEGGLLPLKQGQKVAFIGEFAEKPRFQGAGSSHINVPVSHGALKYCDGVAYAKGYVADSDDIDDTLIAEAVSAAKAADVAVLFVGLPDAYETEGFDREDMKMPAVQLKLIDAVCAAQKNTAVVLHGGSPVEMPWAADVAAILDMHLGGEGVGLATANLLFGKANPGGKLAETYPIKLEDNPSYLNFPGGRGVVHYNEGVFVGYRYYDKKAYDVRFPFGHGLSYTAFAYSDLKVDGLNVSFTVQNTGSVAGDEVAQLYVRNAPATVPRPVRELRAFKRVRLQPGESQAVTFQLANRDLCYWEPRFKDWYAESGQYGIEVGSSSRDIRLRFAFDYLGKPETAVLYTAETVIDDMAATRKGREYLVDYEKKVREKMGIDDMMDIAQMGPGAEKMVRAMMLDAPIGSLVHFGIITPEQLGGLLAELNG